MFFKFPAGRLAADFGGWLGRGVSESNTIRANLARSKKIDVDSEVLVAHWHELSPLPVALAQAALVPLSWSEISAEY